jgi:DNA repair protein RecN (Recombination protein N)
MLISLHIQNYALIRHLEISPSSGMNIITGETGAGKSIMIGAVGLLLGNRADTKVLYDKEKKCIIEGVFNLSEYRLEEFFESRDLDYNTDTIIRREISPSGKSRAFINDTPVLLDVMRALGSFLMDVHSQSDTLMLGSEDYQLSLVDAFAQNQDLLTKYELEFKHYKSLKSKLVRLEAESEKLKKEADYNHFLYEELNEANLNSEEQELYEEELATLEHAEEITSKLMQSIELLQNSEYSIVESLSSVHKLVASLSDYSHILAGYSERLQSTLFELKDLTTEVEKESQKIENDPQRIEELQNRLGQIYRLEQKHQVSSISQLLAIKDGLEEKVNKNIHLDEEIINLTSEVDDAVRTINISAQQLSGSRIKHFEKIVEKIEGLLKNLGIPEARLAIAHDTVPANITGIDEIKLKFSANKGVRPLDLKSVASGGEFSRLMFCIKYIIASRKALPTLILDEIDAGISGEIAIKMANMMQQMSEQHQVIVITHLPQIASAGDRHYFVYKDNTASKSVSLIKELSEEERITEIAKMIGGDHPTEAAFENARELLNKAYIN